MNEFIGTITSIKNKHNRRGAPYLGITAKRGNHKVWFGAPMELDEHVNLGSEVEVQYEGTSHGTGLVFLQGVQVVAIDGEPAPKLKPEPVEASVGNFLPVLALFVAVRAKLAKPRIKARVGEHRVKLYPAGPTSRYHGQVQVVEDAPFGQGRYFGRVDHEGKFVQGRTPAPAEVVEFLRELAQAPAETAAKYGKAAGCCVFCSRELSDDRSLEVGYGPICADHYGLPWGA